MKEQHKAFADYYIETQNGAESYRRAYPNCKSDGSARTEASKLLTKPDVQTYIRERMASKENERIASQDEVLEFLTQVMRGEVKDQLGLETSVKDRKDAAIQLGKRHGIWIEKQQVDMQGEVTHSHEYHVEQTITADPESVQLLKQLWKRQSTFGAPMGDTGEA